jgi:chemotaxis protein methyltransferase CheR
MTALTQADFQTFRTMLKQRTGIALDEGKEYLVESRLAPIVRRDGIEISAIIADVVRRQSGPLYDEVVDAMTTNETSFFRDVHPFEAMRKEVVPQLLEANATRRQLRVLSAASSTGQEAYTMAMMLRTNFPQLADWDVRITGTDLSSYALTRAREARYSQLEVNRGLPATMLRWFRQDGREFVVSDELRKWCDFRPLNLIQPWPPMGSFDIILLRNVLIYFDQPTKENIIRSAASALAPGGVLLLGASETIINLNVPLTSERHGNTTVFRTEDRKAPAWESRPMTSTR